MYLEKSLFHLSAYRVIPLTKEFRVDSFSSPSGLSEMTLHRPPAPSASAEKSAVIACGVGSLLPAASQSPALVRMLSRLPTVCLGGILFVLLSLEAFRASRFAKSVFRQIQKDVRHYVLKSICVVFNVSSRSGTWAPCS